MSDVIVNVSAPVAWYRSSRKPNPSRIGGKKQPRRGKDVCFMLNAVTMIEARLMQGLQWPQTLIDQEEDSSYGA